MLICLKEKPCSTTLYNFVRPQPNSFQGLKVILWFTYPLKCGNQGHIGMVKLTSNRFAGSASDKVLVRSRVSWQQMP